MSQENVEIARSVYAGWERGDYGSAEWAHPDIEFVMADGPTPGNWTGLAGMVEGVRSFLSVWDDWRFAAEGYRQLADGRVLVFTRYSGRGKKSGLKVEQVGSKGASVFAIRDGKVVRLVAYLNRQTALAELGLSEQDARADS
jgi:ketosteroid isomerase-like protein